MNTAKLAAHLDSLDMGELIWLKSSIDNLSFLLPPSYIRETSLDFLALEAKIIMAKRRKEAKKQ